MQRVLIEEHRRSVWDLLYIKDVFGFMLKANGHFTVIWNLHEKWHLAVRSRGLKIRSLVLPKMFVKALFQSSEGPHPL